MAVDKATTDTPCPDPSMHDKHNKLSEQASTAALYVTNPNSKSGRPAVAKEDVLDKDGKLSSKGGSHDRIRNNAALLTFDHQVPRLRSNTPNHRICPVSLALVFPQAPQVLLPCLPRTTRGRRCGSLTAPAPPAHEQLCSPIGMAASLTCGSRPQAKTEIPQRLWRCAIRV